MKIFIKIDFLFQYDKVEEKLSAIPLASSQEKLRSILDELKKNERITDEVLLGI